jgi:hypothetical protein
LLKIKFDGLAAEVAQLKADQAKAQELLDKHQAKDELKEKKSSTAPPNYHRFFVQ